MSFFATIKKNAKLALCGRWGTAVGVSVLVAAVALALPVLEYLTFLAFDREPFYQNPVIDPMDFDFAGFTREFFAVSWPGLLITTVFVLLSMLLLSPLSLGLTRWFYSLVRQETPGFGELFRFFETPRRYFRSLWYFIQINLRCLFWGILFFTPPCGLLIICARFLNIPDIARQTRAIASVGALLALGLLILTALLYIICVNRYALAAYLLCEGDGVTVREAVRLSVRYTKGYRVTFTLFSFSFLGWYLISPFTLFLLLMYVGPYHMSGLALLARYLVEKCRPPKETQEFPRGYHI